MIKLWKNINVLPLLVVTDAVREEGVNGTVTQRSNQHRSTSLLVGWGGE